MNAEITRQSVNHSKLAFIMIKNESFDNRENAQVTKILKKPLLISQSLTLQPA